MKSQTLNLLRKEMKLGNSAQTTIWFICCFGMFFIPNYPVYIGPFYITLSIFMTFGMNQVSHDTLYTVLLPVRKIDTVKARFLFCGMLEVVSIFFAVIAGLIRYFAKFPAPQSGVGITVAFLGLQLIIYSIFNIIFLGNVYKDPVKPGKLYLLAGIMYFVTYAICEFPVWAYFHAKRTLTAAEIAQGSFLARVGLGFYSMDSAFIGKQCLILLGGILIYTGTWVLTFNRAAKQFEKYDM